jgi:hypothetical protein
MTRARLSLVAVLLVVVVAGVAVRIATSAAPAEPAPAARPSDLALLVLDDGEAPIAAVVGSDGSVSSAALVLPGSLELTIPGQGDGTMDEAAQLPPGTVATAAANLLGVWISDAAAIDGEGFAAVVDRAGGVEIGGEMLSGRQVMERLRRAGTDRALLMSDVLRGVFASGVAWQPTDFPTAERPTEIASLLTAARGASVEVLPTRETAGEQQRADPDVVRALVTSAFGFPDRQVVPVIVLNGSGVPGIGEAVAARLIPGGFRVVVSENASSFDHDTTLIVVSSEEHRASGEAVRDLLGVGDVEVAGPSSGLADITVVVGKDLKV